METKPSEKIFITGATGFVGGILAEELKNSFYVITPNLRTTSPENINFTPGSTLIHCAALVHQMKGAPEADYFKINTDLTQKLAQAAKHAGVQHFIFLSTAHVYGDYGDCKNHERKWTEDTPCYPLDAYGRSKLAAENILFGMQDNDFKVSVVRSPMVYGEGAKGNLINLYKLIKYIPVLPFGYYKNRRSLVYVRNLTFLIRKVLETRQEGIFLAQDQAPLSIGEITSYLAQNKKIYLFEIPRPIFWMLFKLKPSFTKRLFGTLALNVKNTNTRLNYVPPYSTQQGFERTVAFLKTKAP